MWMKGKQTILDRCCTRCVLHTVYAAHDVCCTRCMPNRVYAVLSVCSTKCQLMIMTWRDREGWLNFVFCDDGRVVHVTEKDGRWRWEQCGEYKWIWEIRSTTYLIPLGRPRIGVITRRIRTFTRCIGDSKQTRPQNSHTSQFLIMIYTIPSHLSLSRRYTFLPGHSRAYALTVLSLKQLQLRFAYWIRWITPVLRITTCKLHAGYHKDLRAVIASMTCLDICMQLRLMVTERILCGFQSGRDTFRHLRRRNHMDLRSLHRRYKEGINCPRDRC